MSSRSVSEQFCATSKSFRVQGYPCTQCADRVAASHSSTVSSTVWPTRRSGKPRHDGWIHATCRIVNLDATANDVLALSPHVEVLEPPALRNQVAERLRRAAALYRIAEKAGSS